MGNKATASECLERLGVPKDKQASFKINVLDFAIQWLNDNRYGGDLTAATPDKRSALVSEYLASEHFQRFTNLPSSDLREPTKSSLSPWLLQLVDMWSSELTVQQSQEDPAYNAGASSSSASKKRGRPSNTAATPKTPSTKRKKKAGQATNVPAQPISMSWFASKQTESKNNLDLARSVTMGAELEQDIPFRDPANYDNVDNSDNDGSIPSLQEILAEPSTVRLQPTTHSDEEPPTPTPLQKGKAAIRDPPMNLPGSSSHSTMTASHTVDNSNHSIAHTRSPEKTPAPNLVRDLRRIEESSNLYDADDGFTPVDVETSHLTTQQRKTITTIAQPPLTPPPTTRRNHHFMNPDPMTSLNQPGFNAMFPIAPHSPTSANTSHANRAVRAERLVESIQSYIDECEQHSIQMMQSSISSERERHRHQIQAALFLHLKADVQSRVKAYLAEGDGDAQQVVPPETKVTSFCKLF